MFRVIFHFYFVEKFLLAPYPSVILARSYNIGLKLLEYPYAKDEFYPFNETIL